MPYAGRIRVSGNPSAEEIAALVVALDAVAASDAAASGRPRPPAWQYAGRLEAVGGRIVRAPGDLRAPFTAASP